MIRTLRMTVLCGAEHLTEPELRYDLLQRVAETCSGRGLALLAFGLGDEELRLVVEGAAHEVSRAAWRIRIGTSRQIAWRNGTLVWGDDDVREIGDDALDATIAWAHAVHPEDPLATPWTSLRDLLGLRTAAFYDPERVRPRLRQIPIPPRRAAPPPAGPQPALGVVLRVAAAVLGVLPGDRDCFRLFAQLGRTLGYGCDALARALNLTERRIRQLLAVEDPLLPIAILTVRDPRLSVVP